MLILAATNESLQLITTPTGAVDAHVSYVDFTTTTTTPGSQQQAITTAATTTVLAAPGASTQRQVKLLTACNKGTTTITVTLQKLVAAAASVLLSAIQLAPGETLQYLDGQGFSVLDPFARRKEVNSATIANPPGIGSPYQVISRLSDELAQMILVELRLHTFLLATEFGVRDNLETLRADITTDPA